MNIVYALTRNLYPYFKATLNSLLEHNSPKRIYILAEDDTLPYELPSICKVINVSGQKIFPPDCPNANSIYTYMAMMRACYCSLFPRVGKVIQLDIDTVICDSLQPLWDIDLKGKWMAACPEYLGQYNPWQKGTYYNIGVAVFNLSQMRKDGAQAKMVEMLNTRRMKCVEQDAINYLAVPDKVTDIPVRYNECFCCGYTEDPAVVHFAGHKYWYRDRSMYRKEYMDKYLRSPRFV